MAQIHVTDLTFGYEGSFDHVFEHVSFSIDTNWRLGFIGRNGKGKTTFLNLLMGLYDYQGSIAASTVFDYFPYRISREHLESPAAEFAEELKTGCELWRVICELEQLSESPEILYRPFGTLSPGERAKVLLAILFSEENDFLLIDEPTNHLDEAARECVKKYLASKKGFLLVSHDRDLLDACIDHVLVLNRKTIEVQSGNFSSWWENKTRRDQFVKAENEKHLKEIRHLKQAAAQTSQWANQNERTKIGFDPVKEHDRSRATRAYIGAKTKKLQSRVKQMEKRLSQEILEKEGLLEDLESPADLKLTPLSHHRDTLVRIREYGLQYAGAEKPVFTDLTAEIRSGDRIALHGENGCGKSTLLKMILQKAAATKPQKMKNPLPVNAAGRMETGIPRSGTLEIGTLRTQVSETGTPETEILETGVPETGTLETGILESGTLETASGLLISHVSQDTSRLSGTLAEFSETHGLEEHLFLAILRQLDLERTQFSKTIEEFSEGQKKKVLLAASLLTPAHLYIWDEPLNYIDVFTRMQLEKLLLEYQPTMIFVEHDRRFRERVATDTIELP